MIMSKLSNIFLIFFISETFVSHCTIEGATTNGHSQACGLKEWGCDNGECISLEKKCDEASDCSDGSDEATVLCSTINFKVPRYRCDIPKYPDHGTHSVTRVNIPGDKHPVTKLTFFCYAGYSLQGEASTLCIKGVWSSEMPTCEKITNASTDSPELDKSDDTGHRTSTTPIPKPVPLSVPRYRCNRPNYPDHGTFTVTRVNIPSDNFPVTMLTFFCHTGYNLEGETTALCIKGVWSSEVPTCKKHTEVDSVNCTNTSADSPELCNSGSTGFSPTERLTERPVTPSVQEHRCILPQYPDHGKYKATFGTKPGDSVPYTELIYTCDWGYSLEGDTSLYCVQGTWSSETPTCESQCTPLKSTSVNFKCYKQHSTLEIPCDQPQDHNSYAKAECKNSYQSDLPLKNLLCIEGFWDYMPYCTPECGTATPRAQHLVIKGEVAKIGEFPWHVGLYDKTLKPIEQICGGTIFSPKVVVTAAHCVYSDGVGVRLASRYAVAAGKLYRDWDTTMDDEKYVQKIDVIKIEIPQQYKGTINAYTADIAVLVLKTSFVLNSLIRPVCIKLDYKYDLNGKLGKVAGWGLTAEDGPVSPILQTVSLPFVSFQECYDKSPESFKPLIIADKICAGYTNGTALCRGDSGGGLVFPRRNNFQDLHYLYGIVSSSPRNQELTSCSASAYTSFTDLRKHQEWFQDVWSLHNIIG